MKRKIIVVAIVSCAVVAAGIYAIARSRAPTGAVTNSRDASARPVRKDSAVLETAASPKFKPPANYNPQLPVNLAGLSVGRYVATRYQAARLGDANAAYDIYRAESICANMENQKNTLALSNRDPDAQEAVRASMQADSEVCRDVTPAQIQERLQYLGAAAKAGIVEAQINYFAEGPFGSEHDSPDNSGSSNAATEEWKKNAIGYLTQLAQQGNNTALAYLSLTYENGDIAPKDLKLALTYEIASVLGKNADPGNSPVVSRLEKQLPADQVSGALAAATELMQRCCGSGS